MGGTGQARMVQTTKHILYFLSSRERLSVHKGTTALYLSSTLAKIIYDKTYKQLIVYGWTCPTVNKTNWIVAHSCGMLCKINEATKCV